MSAVIITKLFGTIPLTDLVYAVTRNISFTCTSDYAANPFKMTLDRPKNMHDSEYKHLSMDFCT